MKTFAKFINEAVKVDSSFIPKELNRVKDKIIGKDLGNLEIAEILNKALRYHHVDFEPGFVQSGDSDMARVSISLGVIDVAGGIHIQYEKDFYEQFSDDDTWPSFVNVVHRLVEHELVHRFQIQRISSKYHGYKRDQILSKLEADPHNLDSYLGSSQEIPAFARQAVLEIRQAGYSDAIIAKYLRNPFARGARIWAGDSNTLWLYTDWFQQGDKELNKFFVQMYRIIKEKQSEAA